MPIISLPTHSPLLSIPPSSVLLLPSKNLLTFSPSPLSFSETTVIYSFNASSPLINEFIKPYVQCNISSTNFLLTFENIWSQILTLLKSTELPISFQNFNQRTCYDLLQSHSSWTSVLTVILEFRNYIKRDTLLIQGFRETGDSGILIKLLNYRYMDGVESKGLKFLKEFGGKLKSMCENVGGVEGERGERSGYGRKVLGVLEEFEGRLKGLKEEENLRR
ncbi:hypothetical protein TrLO_g1272 [Triparma laevis f. longispina]|uniref:Uncharacterized protein n=1 Tax=Triparma laevis f. longispina TaxID=1714387 RepID=A0A9W7FC99_9STRA|nr:hypothetical protein TrLO_g1272 [Triparma laevis f. longispina]